MQINQQKSANNTEQARLPSYDLMYGKALMWGWHALEQVLTYPCIIWMQHKHPCMRSSVFCLSLFCTPHRDNPPAEIEEGRLGHPAWLAVLPGQPQVTTIS